MQQTACLGPVERLESLYQQQPGLAARMQQAALTANDGEALISGLKARHLTRTRVQRLLSYAALFVTAEEMTPLLQHPPSFLPLLGATVCGEKFLRQCRKQMSVPLAGNFSRLIPQLKRFYGSDSQQMQQALNLLSLHNRVARSYTLLLPEWQGASRHWDFYREPWRE